MFLTVLILILLIAAAFCFYRATFPQRYPTNRNLIALGLLFWILTVLIPMLLRLRHL